MRHPAVAVALIFTVTLSVSAQQAGPPAVQPAVKPSGMGWDRVQALAAGRSVDVKAKKQHAICKLQSVGDGSLTCVHGDTARVEIFQLADIQWVKLPRRERSAPFGTIPGGALAGIGGIVGVAEHCQGMILCGVLAGFLIVTGVVVAGGIAAANAIIDGSGKTVYRAP